MISNIFTGLKVGLGLTTNVILNQPSTTPLDNPIPIDAVTVVRQLRKLSLKVKGDFMDASGSIVNYNACKASTTFMEYKMLASKLSVISFNDLDTVHRKAFFINLYNSMIIHALIEGLLPDPGTISRLNMYATVSYNLGGYIFSLNDIENGLLRGNRRSAVPLSKPPFDGHDSRQSLMIECDPRIHFCLNCGAKSCPPISVYSEDPNVLDQQMTMATKGFLDGNTKVNLLEGCITLSMLFQWSVGRTLLFNIVPL